MKIIILKKPVVIGIIIGILLLLGAGIFLLSGSRKPNAKAILAETKRYDLQNICLLALLEEDPKNQDYWQQLLDQYQALGADPLTIYAARQEAKEQTGADLSPTPGAGSFTPGAPIKPTADNGLAHGGKNFYAGAYDGTAVTYLAAEDGLYAEYRGIRVRLAPIRADRLLPAENGLYYINTTQHRVQFIATDGGTIRTLSTLDAMDYAFLDESLYILGTDGVLYHNGTQIDLPGPGQRLAATNEGLFVALEEGIYSVGEKKTIYDEKANQLMAHEGVLYFINDAGYPCRLKPGDAQATLLKKAKAISLDQEQYLSSKNKLKKFRSK